MTNILIRPNQPPPIQVTGGGSPVHVTTAPPRPVDVTVASGKQGVPGPPGPPGDDAQWDSMTLAEYQALNPKDPNTLYVIIG